MVIFLTGKAATAVIMQQPASEIYWILHSVTSDDHDFLLMQPSSFKLVECRTQTLALFPRNSKPPYYISRRIRKTFISLLAGQNELKCSFCDRIPAGGWPRNSTARLTIVTTEFLDLVKIQKSEISDKKGNDKTFSAFSGFLGFFWLPVSSSCKKIKSLQTSLPRASSLQVDMGHHQPCSLSPCDLVEPAESCDGILLCSAGSSFCLCLN